MMGLSGLETKGGHGMTQWPNQNDVDSFYGNPRGVDGQASAAWEQKNLTIVEVPWQLVTSWDGAPVKSIRCHHKCAESLDKILKAIWVAAGRDEQNHQVVGYESLRWSLQLPRDAREPHSLYALLGLRGRL